MRSLVTVACTLAAIAIAAQDTHAQSTQAREGFFIGLGLGGGSFSCSTCADRQSGLTGHLKLGGTLNQQLLLGVESNAWTKEEAGVRFTHANFSAMAQVYPAGTSGFFLRGGVGVSTLEVSASSGGSSASVRESGLGLTAGLGYDLRVGSNFSITPYGTFGWGDHDGGTANNVQLGVGVTWH